jgi:hypothetical protein
MPANRRANFATLALALVSSICFVTNKVYDLTMKIKYSGRFQSMHRSSRVLSEQLFPVVHSRSLRALSEASMITSMEGMASVHHHENPALNVRYTYSQVQRRHRPTPTTLR